MNKTLTCIECPIGCQINVELNNNEILSVSGNNCKRGEMYAKNEVICPRRVLTTTVKCKNGGLIAVKTDKPVKKVEQFKLMEEINKIVVDFDVKIGDTIIENLVEDINLIATSNCK